MSQQGLNQVVLPDEEIVEEVNRIINPDEDGGSKKLPHHAQIPFTPGHLTQCEDDYLLLPSEVADLFRVDAKTVSRWAGQPGITDIRTPGNHHRFKAGEIKKLYFHEGNRAMVEGLA